MGFTLHVENYRGLRQVSWSPSGVCALTGPNGSGKTTLLSAVEFLRHFLQRGIQPAVELSGGPEGLFHQAAAPAEGHFISFMLRSGGCQWVTSLLPSEPPHFMLDESLVVDDAVAAQQSFSGTARIGILALPSAETSILARAMGSLPPEERQPYNDLYVLAMHFRLYQPPHLRTLRSAGSPLGTDLYLHSNGANAFSLLRNWKAGRREHEERWLFVREGLRECFPGLFEDLEFLVEGQSVTVRFFFKGLREPLSARAVPHGLLLAMMHLCALASTPDHGALAIDEFENGLHPQALQMLLEFTRVRAAMRDLTVLLATHSPTVLNTFDTEPDHVFIMEPERGRLPIALSEHPDPQWLARFALGTAA